MIFRVLNTTGSAITLGGTSYANNSWVDILPYWAFQSFEVTQNDIDGRNAGRNASNGDMIRDKVNEKEKVNFVSVPTSMSNAMALKNLVRPETFTVKTDMFTGASKDFKMYSNNRVLTHILSRNDKEPLFKISFPLIEV